MRHVNHLMTAARANRCDCCCLTTACVTYAAVLAACRMVTALIPAALLTPEVRVSSCSSGQGLITMPCSSSVAAAVCMTCLSTMCHCSAASNCYVRLIAYLLSSALLHLDVWLSSSSTGM